MVNSGECYADQRCVLSTCGRFFTGVRKKLAGVKFAAEDVDGDFVWGFDGKRFQDQVETPAWCFSELAVFDV